LRIIGLDYGSKTVGVALSDELLLTAQPFETIVRERKNKLRRTYARIEEIIKEYQVEKIIIGLPKKMDDEEGDMCAEARAFGDDLQRRTGLDVIYIDERLTTKAAGNVLTEGNVRRINQKKYIDKIAASLILKTYLEEHAAEKG
jgi:putative Holliday junction resolvase